MSRTFRRKNWEATSGKVPGSKIGGYYVHQEFGMADPCTGHGMCYWYRESTPQEYRARYWAIHGESNNNCAWSPNRAMRRQREKSLRYHFKREIQRCLHTPEYEAQFVCDASLDFMT